MMIISPHRFWAGAEPSLPTTIGEEFGGGYYIGDITVADGGANDGTYAVIMAPPAGETAAQWKTTNSTTTGTTSLTDGAACTAAMMIAGSAAHPAGQHCDTYAGGGYADWYMPAKNELNLAWTNRASLAALAMQAGWYFSSTQASSSNAWAQYFHPASGTQTTVGKGESYNVRPVRRLRR